MQNRILPALLGLFFLTAGISIQAQPDYFNFQGLLRDSEGELLESGAYEMEFNIFSVASGGTAIWGPFIFDGTETEGHTKLVQVTNGQFNVILGPTDTTSRNLSTVFGGDTAFIQMNIGGSDPILPRQQILSTPYSFEAKHSDNATTADTLNNVAPVQYLNPPGMIAPFAGASDRIPTGWLICDGSELVSTEYPALYAVLGKTWGGRTDGDVEYFNVPDLRGMFLRGANLARSDDFADEGPRTDLDPAGDEIPANLVDAGTLENDAIKLHRHAWAIGFDSQDLHTWHVNETEYKVLEYVGQSNQTGSGSNEDNYLDVRLGNDDRLYTAPDSTIDSNESNNPGETRPNNAAVNYIIKL